MFSQIVRRACSSCMAGARPRLSPARLAIATFSTAPANLETGKPTLYGVKKVLQDHGSRTGAYSVCHRMPSVLISIQQQSRRPSSRTSYHSPIEWLSSLGRMVALVSRVHSLSRKPGRGRCTASTSTTRPARNGLLCNGTSPACEQRMAESAAWSTSVETSATRFVLMGSP